MRNGGASSVCYCCSRRSSCGPHPTLWLPYAHIPSFHLSHETTDTGSQTLFADNTYSKPYLVTYVNTACFIIPLFPIVVRRLYLSGSLKTPRYSAVPQDHEEDAYAQEHTSDSASQKLIPINDSQAIIPLSLGETARLSLEFCILWFMANYFVAACLEHTTVASSTILTSTSSIFTLLLGCAVNVEIFTLRKLFGVLASLLGVVLISSVDLFGNSDKGRGSFPHKDARQVALGDAMALLSAVLYGVYAVLMKKRIGDERRISMPVFFGLVGLFNVLLLWPGFLVLHFTGVEPFELPPTSRVTTIILVCVLVSHITSLSLTNGRSRSTLSAHCSLISHGHMPCYSLHPLSLQ